MRLTEVDGDKLVFFQNLLQHFSVDFFDFSGDLENFLRRQPRQDAFLVRQVALEHDRDFLTEINLNQFFVLT